MPVPKKRNASSVKGRRRADIFLKKITLNKCPKCSRMVKPHTACSFCGSYKGKDAIKVKEIIKKKKNQ